MESPDLDCRDPLKHGVIQEAAIKRLHVIQEGKEVPAFEIIWEQIPRYKWLALLVSTPILRQLSNIEL